MDKSTEKAFFALAKIDEMPIATMSTETLQRSVQSRINRVMKLCESDDPAIANAAQDAIDKYVESQKDLFASKGLDENRAYGEMIVPYTDGNRQLCRIIKRQQSFMPDYENESRSAVSTAGYSYANAVGMAKEAKRGKYNDAALLIEQSAASVDREEVVSWTRM